MDEIDNQEENSGRPPETVRETVLANMRPQPAIPAVLVFFLGVLMPTIFTAGSDAPLWLNLLIAAGIVASCGLAIAAGFCSVAPHMIWFALAIWVLNLDGPAVLAGFNETLLVVGLLAVAIGAALQIWRIRTGKFVPTIRDEPGAGLIP